jgi:hypothetical protein
VVAQGKQDSRSRVMAQEKQDSRFRLAPLQRHLHMDTKAGWDIDLRSNLGERPDQAQRRKKNCRNPMPPKPTPSHLRTLGAKDCQTIWDLVQIFADR